MRRHIPRHINVRSGEKGQAIIEFALVVPLLLVLFMGVFDYARAFHAQSIISNMSREAANLIARANMNLSGDESKDFQDVMDLVGKTAQPLDMTAQGMMYMYKVECVANKNTITLELAWNRSSLSPKPARSSAAKDLGGISLCPSQVAYGVEVYYEYEGVFLGSGFVPTLSSQSIF